MRLDASLQQRLEQRMVLAPRMIQAMEILQLPLAALQERIDQELVENPVIEIRETRPEENPGPAAEPAAASTDADGEQDLVVKDDGGPEDFQRLSDLVDRWENYFEQTGRRPRRPAADGPDTKMEAMQNTPDAGQTLQEYLLDQWRLEEADPRVRVLGEAIVRSLDDNGYLRSPLEDLAGEVDPPATPDELEDALRRVQAVDAAGVGARDLTECIDEVKRAVQRIQRLNPKPGAAFSPQRTPPIMPDVHIRWDEEAGEYVVTIEGSDTPELYVSKAYRRMVKQRDLEEKTRRFVAKNIRSARWLMDAIQQRRDTLQRVTESIVRFQRPFFDDGPEHVQPLKMQQVADDVGLHVGTISRAVADKYADTPWGIWALRAFFTGGTEMADGQEVSWDRVRVHLKQIVGAEDKCKPLSDEAIARRLKDQGIDVARRTAAKYREEMDIPSSRRRREY